VFNNIVLITANMVLDHPEDYNMEAVRLGMYWYAASAIGFLGMLSSWLNHYFLFDDFFVMCTCFSLFYCWQMHTDDTLTLTEVWYDFIHMRTRIREYIAKKKRKA